LVPFSVSNNVEKARRHDLYS